MGSRPTSAMSRRRKAQDGKMIWRSSLAFWVDTLSTPLPPANNQFYRLVNIYIGL